LKKWFCVCQFFGVFFFFFGLFVLFQVAQAIFSYLAAVTITGDRTANLGLCLALTAFSSKGSFMCHTYCDTVPVFKVISERLMILTSECCAIGEGAMTTYFKRLMFDAAGPSGARTHNLPNAKREHYY
jgi:hypothetical protein